MKKIFSLLLVACLCLSATSPLAAAQPTETILTVHGEGESEDTPNQATLVVGITTHAAKSDAAQETNAVKTHAVLDALKEMGIAPGDMQTGNFSVYPYYNESKEHNRQIDGYTVNNSVIVKILNIGAVGQVIDTALKNGANNINSLEFGLRDHNALRKNVLKKAVADAGEKAEIIAKELGLKIKGIKSVSENVGPAMNLRNGALMSGMAKKSDTDTAIEVGTLSLRADVHIEYVLGN